MNSICYKEGIKNIKELYLKCMDISFDLNVLHMKSRFDTYYVSSNGEVSLIINLYYRKDNSLIEVFEFSSIDDIETQNKEYEKFKNKLNELVEFGFV